MQQNETSKAPPQLDAPGAGIPLLQKLVLRIYIRPFIAAKSSPETSKQTFEKVTAKILKEIEGLTAFEISEPVLVPPQKGLEDSSRYWSIAMTLEHMGIVGRKLGLVVEALSNHLPINEKADIGKLKPFGQMSVAESVEDFKRFAFEEFPKIKVLQADCKNKFKHPWFGNMIAREWYWLIGAHQMIHLKQIREIKKGLSKGRG